LEFRLPLVVARRVKPQSPNALQDHDTSLRRGFRRRRPRYAEVEHQEVAVEPVNAWLRDGHAPLAVERVPIDPGWVAQRINRPKNILAEGLARNKTRANERHPISLDNDLVASGDEVSAVGVHTLPPPLERPQLLPPDFIAVGEGGNSREYDHGHGANKTHTKPVH
jgi:hypothetical protein